MDVLIPRNTNIPTQMSETYTTTADNETGVVFQMFEGERVMVQNNHKVGQFNIEVLAAPRGTP